ncbi:MAG: S8 family serine peptidase [Clostridiales Family XIII bacterium]|jgi:uncharacterized repeat protein (TIGR02543 family)|nr:S8 family serine peptidase [Clostridiales Family XIII bacterium]
MKKYAASKTIAVVTALFMLFAILPAGTLLSAEAAPDEEGSALAAIDALTVEPDSGKDYRSYIVEIKPDRVDDIAPDTDEFAVSPLGDIIVVEKPEDALEFAAPEDIVSISPNVGIEVLGFPATGEPNDPEWTKQWQFQERVYPRTVSATTNASINLLPVAGTGMNGGALDGDGVSVATIDTGIYAHPDFRKDFAAAHGLNFGKPTGLADDDVSWYGSVPTKAGIVDTMGHGTKVAGLLAAIANNGVGFAGMADKAEIYPYKVTTGSTGRGEVSSIIFALEHMLDNNEIPDVINVSMGTDVGEIVPTGLEKAINALVSRGAIIIAAAGNHGGSSHTPDATVYPAGYDNVIGVANINVNGTHRDNSAENSQVNVAAPGTSLYLTSVNPGDESYPNSGGTSYAAPLVAGVAAQLKQIDKSITAAEFKALLKQTSLKIATNGFAYDADGHSDSVGYGLLDAAAMVQAYKATDDPAKTHRIVFSLDGGSFVGANTVPEFLNSDKIGSTTYPVPGNVSKAGFVFAGWYLESSYATSITQITAAHLTALSAGADLNLYAKWTVDPQYAPHSIVFNLNGGAFNGAHSVPASLSAMQAATPVTLPTNVSRSGHNFGGWYLEPALTNRVTQITAARLAALAEGAALNLYAKWTAASTGGGGGGSPYTPPATTTPPATSTPPATTSPPAVSTPPAVDDTVNANGSKPPVVAKPPTPALKKITLLGGRKMYITVTPRGTILRQQVRYRVQGTKTWKVKTVSANTMYVTLSNLKKGKIYQIQVRSYTKAGSKNVYSAWGKVRRSPKIR